MNRSGTSTLEKRVSAFLEAGRPAQAERLAGNQPQETASAELLRLLAVSRSQRGDDAAAERLLRIALRRDPSAQLAHSDLGVLLAQRGKWRIAAATFERALVLDPSDKPALLYLATAQRHLGALRSAIGLYRRILEHEPAELSAIEGLVLASKEAADLEGTLPDLERALAAAPRDRHIRGWMADVHFEHGREEVGCDHLVQAGALPPAKSSPSGFTDLLAIPVIPRRRSAELSLDGFAATPGLPRIRPCERQSGASRDRCASAI